jgi:hypothetical protein
MTIKYTNIFHSKALQNLPKLGVLVWKTGIWQPWFERSGLIGFPPVLPSGYVTTFYWLQWCVNFSMISHSANNVRSIHQFLWPKAWRPGHQESILVSAENLPPKFLKGTLFSSNNSQKCFYLLKVSAEIVCKIDSRTVSSNQNYICNLSMANVLKQTISLVCKLTQDHSRVTYVCTHVGQLHP